MAERAQRHLSWRVLMLTGLAMVAFAANSLLCRFALRQGLIDPASFGAVRLLAGAVTLAAIACWPGRPRPVLRPDWIAAAMLFAYVGCFSFAYLSLPAGTGALILFGAVQLTMLGLGLLSGERLLPLAWLGFMLAVAGLVYLVWPGVAAPPAWGSVLMAMAGVAWGVYSLRGRGVADPIGATARNFIWALPLGLGLSLVSAADAQLQRTGVVLAIASGAISSGIGYAIWYAALPQLGALRAAAVQLAVPLIAALGGVSLLAEALTARLVLASAAILGGIALVLAHPTPSASRTERIDGADRA
jgi:drug/metabolite transporter (DMT)-like permease